MLTYQNQQLTERPVDRFFSSFSTLPTLSLPPSIAAFSVILGDSRPEEPMAAISERDRSLHNFSFPNWGFLRHMKATPSTIHSSFPQSDGPNLPPPDPSSSPQLQSLPKSVSDNLEEAEKHEELPKTKKPWNLREKKSASDAPSSVGNSAALAPPPEENRVKSLRLRSLAAAAREEGKEKKEKLKFSIALSREEINTDFVALTGSKPPRRPRKRPRNVQIELDLKFPGLWLAEITPDSYTIPETCESKRGRLAQSRQEL